MQICCSQPTLASRQCRTRIKVWANETSIRADFDVIHIACTASTPSTAYLSTLRYTWVTCKMIFASNCRGSCSANDSSSNGKLPEDKNNWIFQLRAANSFVAFLHTHIYIYVCAGSYICIYAKSSSKVWEITVSPMNSSITIQLSPFPASHLPLVLSLSHLKPAFDLV